MAVKLHRCSTMWLKIGAHPCWKVQKALDEQGIEPLNGFGVIPLRGSRENLPELDS